MQGPLCAELAVQSGDRELDSNTTTQAGDQGVDLNDRTHTRWHGGGTGTGGSGATDSLSFYMS